MSFFDELKRRNVFRVGIAYLVVSWLLLQIIDVVVPILVLPDWVARFMLLLLLVGFIPVLIAAWAFELTPDGLKKEKDVDRTQSITPQTGHKLDRAIIGILTVALAWFIWDKFAQVPGELGPTTKPETTQLTAVAPDPVSKQNPPAKSIAVLPFANMSDDASNEYFSDGISEEILNALAKVRELKVAGRTSSFAFKGRNEDLRMIGKALGVSHILEGSVRKAGNTVRITAQLIQVDDGFHLWSETYDRELTDIFAIQDEIANAILQQLKAQLVGGGQITSTRADTQAYEKYLLAKQRIYGRSQLELELALTLLDESIEMDQNFAPAFAQRGITTLMLSEQGYGTIPHEEALQTARKYLEKSLQLDENLAEGLAGMGFYYRRQTGASNQEPAIDYLRRALAINPSLTNASNWLANQLTTHGRYAEAQKIYMAMHENDPMYRPAIGNLINAFLRMGQPDRAQAVVDKVRPYSPDDADLSRASAGILLATGRFGEAYPLAQFAWERAPTNLNTVFTRGLSLAGSNQFEKLANLSDHLAGLKLYALRMLGRTEEGTLFAQKLVEHTGNPAELISFLVNTERADEAALYLEQNWPQLNLLEAEYGGHLGSFGYGHGLMLDIAWIYQQTGDPDKFEQAMEYVRSVHNEELRNGANNMFIRITEAGYWLLRGDQQRALDELARAMDIGWTATPRISQAMPIFKPLEGLPRYEALQIEALKHLNQQRALMDLEPLELDRTL